MLYLFGNLSWPSTRIETHLQIFCKIFCNPILQPGHMKSSRSPTTKCCTFLETSHDPLQGLQLICKFLQIFFCNPFFANPQSHRNTNTKCHTFLETSPDPLQGSQLIHNFLQFFATVFCQKVYYICIILLYHSEAFRGECPEVRCPTTLIATLSTPV